jgi:hypothetical protein
MNQCISNSQSKNTLKELTSAFLLLCIHDFSKLYRYYIEYLIKIQLYLIFNINNYSIVICKCKKKLKQTFHNSISIDNLYPTL